MEFIKGICHFGLSADSMQAVFDFQEYLKSTGVKNREGSV